MRGFEGKGVANRQKEARLYLHFEEDQPIRSHVSKSYCSASSSWCIGSPAPSGLALDGTGSIGHSKGVCLANVCAQ